MNRRLWTALPPAVAARLADRLDRRLAARPRRGVVATRVGPTEVDTADLVDRYLHLFGVWEPHLTRWLPTRLGPGDVLVDVGAYTGWFSRLAADAGCDAVAVEPSPEAVARLRRHTAGHPRVRVVHAAVGDGGDGGGDGGDGTRAFRYPDPGNRGGASAAGPGRGSEAAFTAPVRTLADLLDDDEIARTRLVKIDVEGDEAEVVADLVPLLDRMPAAVEIAVEVAPDRLAARGRTPDDVVGPLRDRGFHVYRLPNDYRAASYPAQLSPHVAPRPPVRFDEPLDVQHDLVLSRIDADALTAADDRADSSAEVPHGHRGPERVTPPGSP